MAGCHMLCRAQPAFSQEKDMKTVYYNGNIITLEGDNIQAFAVEDGRFIKTGTDSQVKEAAADGEMVDLGGKTVLPAFFETHMHILSLGMLLKDINHNDCDSITGLIEKSRKYIEDHHVPAGKWVRGRGWNQDHFKDEARFITRYDLDKITTEHPLCFVRTCGHVIVTNSKGLEMIGMENSAPHIDGGQIDLDENGVPLGIFRERARACILDAIPEQEVEEIKELILLAQDEAAAHGIVEIHSDDFKDVPTNYKKVIQAYTELIEEGKLKIRVYEQCNLPAVEKIQDFLDNGYHTGWNLGEDMYTLGPLKLLSDGALGARTAYLNAPYSDDPSQRGMLLFTTENLRAMVKMCHEAGMQIAIHAIGDGAVDEVMDAIEEAQQNWPRLNERHGIIHCQVTTPAQLERMKKLNLIAYIQPIFLNYDLKILDDRLGPERAATAYDWKSFFDFGLHPTGSSDCPVESLNVMENIYAAMVRKDLDGNPAGGWKPEQDLTLDQALRLFTINSAYACFCEESKGSIKIGKSADFVVIDRDIQKTIPDDIKDIKVEQTYLRGKKIFDIADQPDSIAEK